jgi:uncharacterized protein (TIGR03067 family)
MHASVFIALVLAAPAPKEGKEAPAKLDGSWVVEKYLSGGKEEVRRAGSHLTFADGKVHVREEKGSEVPYTLDPKADPPRIDLREGKNAIRGIYRFERDRLTICFPKGGEGERPTKFESPAGTRIVLMVLKREKK